MKFDIPLHDLTFSMRVTFWYELTIPTTTMVADLLEAASVLAIRLYKCQHQGSIKMMTTVSHKSALSDLLKANHPQHRKESSFRAEVKRGLAPEETLFVVEGFYFLSHTWYLKFTTHFIEMYLPHDKINTESMKNKCQK